MSASVIEAASYLSYRLPEEFLASYVDREPPFGFPCGGGNTLGEITFIGKHSNLKPDGSKERWWEVCQRVVEGMYSTLKDHCLRMRTPWTDEHAHEDATQAFDRMFNFKWMPAGRGVQYMGTEFVARHGSAVLQSCAFLSTQDIAANPWKKVCRLMEMSMLGIGVGMDTRGEGKIKVRNDKPRTHVEFVIPDSREGWVESLRLLIESFFVPGATDPDFDYSLIRPAGSPLKTLGGFAGGPEVLWEMHNRLRARLGAYRGQYVDSRLIADMANIIGYCVVSGNNRRTAEIIFGRADDKDFLNLKNWMLEENAERMHPVTGWGGLSNNTVFRSEDMSHVIEAIPVNGEPGIYDLELAQQYGRLIDPPNGKDWRVLGANPCVTGETWVLTEDGPRRAVDLVGISVPLLVDGKSFPMESNGFWKTGTKPVLKIATSEGYSLRLTKDHKVMTHLGWLPAGNLKSGHKIQLHEHDAATWGGSGTDDEGYLLGLLAGDGCVNGGEVVLSTWDKDEGSATVRRQVDRIVRAMPHRSDWMGWKPVSGRGEWRLRSAALTKLAASYGMLDTASKKINDHIETASSDFNIGFLRGLFDADGHVEGNSHCGGVSIRLSTSIKENAEAVQRMLLRLGIKSCIRAMNPARMQDLPDGRGGTSSYDCKASWRCIIAGAQAERFFTLVGFLNVAKAEKYVERTIAMKRGFYEKAKLATVTEVTEDGVEDVYDVTVQEVHAFDANGMYVHNCAEQPLEDNELCNLVEVFPTHHDGIEDFKRTLKYAYLYGKVVTLIPTHWPEANEIMVRNRRIGLSLTGLFEFTELYGWQELRTWLDAGYAEVCRRDVQYSDWLGIRESIKMTSVKPSGTVSLEGGVTPGVHAPVVGGCYLRRARYGVHNPIIPVLEAAGYPVEPAVNDPERTMVVTFPVRGPEVRSETEVSVWEKAHLAALLQAYWADNMVSATFSFLPEETNQIRPLIDAFEGKLKCMSFLPKEPLGQGYDQMPYEQVSMEEFERIEAGIRPIDRDALYLVQTQAQGDKFCDSDACTV